MSVVLEDDDFETIKEALDMGDKLCTAAVSGQSVPMRQALEYARVMNDLKRKKIITNK